MFGYDTLMNRPRKNSKRPTGDSGFTLAEVLVVVVISAMVFTTIIRFSTENTRRLTRVSHESQMQDRMQVTIGRFRADVRDLAYDPASVGTVGTYITIAAATSLAFKGDIDGDNALETVSYRLAGTNMERSVSDQLGGNYSTLATGVQSIAFSYRDINGNVTGTLANVRMIKLTLTFQSDSVDPGKNPPQFLTYSVNESIFPRNL